MIDLQEVFCYNNRYESVCPPPPQVSVLIPIWNVEKYIERCLRSVFEQTIADQAEFILVNDCSPDNSMKIAETVINDYPHLKNQIKVINHETNRGLAAARISAFSQAQGKYIINVDSDDWVEPNYLEELLNAAEREDADVVGCNLIMEWGNRSLIIKAPLLSDGKECARKILAGELSGYLCIKLMKKEVINSNPGDWWVEGLDLGEDFLFSVQFFYYARKIVYIDKELYHYEQGNNNSLSVQKYTSPQKCRQIINITARISNFLEEKNIFAEYRSAFELYKAKAKMRCLNSLPQDRKNYYSLWPGVYKYIKITSIKQFYVKTLLFLCDCRLYGLVNLLIKIKNSVKG